MGISAMKINLKVPEMLNNKHALSRNCQKKKTIDKERETYFTETVQSILTTKLS